MPSMYGVDKETGDYVEICADKSGGVSIAQEDIEAIATLAAAKVIDALGRILESMLGKEAQR